jgi:hypothetical protein
MLALGFYTLNGQEINIFLLRGYCLRWAGRLPAQRGGVRACVWNWASAKHCAGRLFLLCYPLPGSKTHVFALFWASKRKEKGISGRTLGCNTTGWLVNELVAEKLKLRPFAV